MTKTPEELTEEWKAGKLNDGEKYFIRYKNSIFIATFRYFKAYINYWRFIDNGIEYYDDLEEGLIEVLAPVPTYDEYKATQEQLNKEETWYTEISYKKLEKENNKLRGLLKECKEKIHQEFICSDYLSIDKFFDLLARINAAIDESEE